VNQISPKHSAEKRIVLGDRADPSPRFLGAVYKTIVGTSKLSVPNRMVGFYQEAGTDRSTFAVISLWGKFGGLFACGATFSYIVPLPNNFLTRLFSKTRLKRKDFQVIARLAWAQEVPSSNLGAPTNLYHLFIDT
jgi:hypothetical protein